MKQWLAHAKLRQINQWIKRNNTKKKWELLSALVLSFSHFCGIHTAARVSFYYSSLSVFRLSTRHFVTYVNLTSRYEMGLNDILRLKYENRKSSCWWLSRTEQFTREAMTTFKPHNTISYQISSSSLILLLRHFIIWSRYSYCAWSSSKKKIHQKKKRVTRLYGASTKIKQLPP